MYQPLARFVSPALLATVVLLLTACSGSSAPDSPPAVAADPPGRDFIVSSQADFDALTGVTFNGGDRILLQRGEEFAGTLSLSRSSNRSAERIVVSAIGDESLPRPVIRANAPDAGIVDIRNSGGWTVENLELINESAQRSKRHGIYIMAEDSGTHTGFTVRNCYVHDVTGEPGDKNNGGIIFRVWGSTVPTRFNDILVEDNVIENISGVGIRIKSPWEADVSDSRQGSNEIGRFAFQNVVVRGNRISHITKNALIVASSDSPLIEYNVMGPAIATEVTGNSLFIFATDSALVRYNEAFGNTGPADDPDRGGFDADWNSRDTVFEYNYSHDNNYAFAIMRRYHDGLRIRNNISENERYGFIYYGFPTENKLEDIEISNNTFYSTSTGMQLFMNFGRVREPVNSTFVDNIFYFESGDATWGAEPRGDYGVIFENNIVVGLLESGYTGPSSDPLLAAPGTGGTDIDMRDADRLSGYRLCADSPAIGARQQTTDPVETDFWSANAESQNIGAYGGLGIQCQ